MADLEFTPGRVCVTLNLIFSPQTLALVGFETEKRHAKKTSSRKCPFFIQGMEELVVSRDLRPGRPWPVMSIEGHTNASIKCDEGFWGGCDTESLW